MTFILWTIFWLAWTFVNIALLVRAITEEDGSKFWLACALIVIEIIIGIHAAVNEQHASLDKWANACYASGGTVVPGDGGIAFCQPKGK